MSALTEEIRAAVREALRPLEEELARIRAELAAAKNPSEYLTVPAAARVGSVSQDTIRDWIAKGELPEYRAGRNYRVRRQDLDAALARARSTRNAPAPAAEADAILGRKRH